MRFKQILAISLPLLMTACAIDTPSMERQELSMMTPQMESGLRNGQIKPGENQIESQIIKNDNSESVTIKLDLNQQFKTQNININHLSFIKMTLVGYGISGSLNSNGGSFIPVIGGVATATISNVPLSAGRVRVVSVQGYDANQNALPAFVAKGFYRSSLKSTRVNLSIGRRYLLAGYVLERLIAEGNNLVNTLNTADLQTQMESATGFNSGTKKFTTDPTRMNIENLVNLVKSGNGSLTSTQVSTTATVNPVNVTLHLKTPQGGNLNEEIKISIDDPNSVEQSITAGTVSPMTATLNVNPGTWNVKVEKADGTLLSSTSVMVTMAGAYTLNDGDTIPNAISLTGIAEILNPCSTPCNIERFAGNASATSAGDAGPALAAGLGNPFGMVKDEAGNLYVAQPSFNKVRKISTDGTISTFAGSGNAGSLGDGGTAVAAELNGATHVAVDGNGLIYIADRLNHAVRRVNSDGKMVTIAGTLGTMGSSGDNGPATAATLFEPQGIAFDNQGNLYIADSGTGNSAIRKVDTNGTITTFAGGSFGTNGEGVQATAAQMFIPTDIDVDSAGNVYVVEEGRATVRKISTDGMITTIAGRAGLLGNGTNGPATATRMMLPKGVAVDANGNVYVADSDNHAIRKIDANGNISNFVGVVNFQGTSGDNGPALSARLDTPMDVMIDSNNNVYVSTFGGDVVRKVSQ